MKYNPPEKQTWIVSVHSRSMKIVVYTMDLRLRASPRHGGKGVFYEFFSHRSAVGASHRERRHSSYLVDGVVTIPALHPNNTI
jgi:hypothetical protein